MRYFKVPENSLLALIQSDIFLDELLSGSIADWDEAREYTVKMAREALETWEVIKED